MSKKLEIPARIDESGSVRMGESVIIMGQQMVVCDDILTVYETRQFSGFRQQQVLVGRYQLVPVKP
jgi:hypothetical protein